ncbi:hypothetical protein HRI_000688000 [Hibiscus trionum]|uniref:Uncharacterized protein n=1 Tax=Hibiscus trionum TaxID=183268 RepID=A0A9W7LML6_HIBTR|nr:hypothetical protein HRI_000688000 [Hibiscus trionum]
MTTLATAASTASTYIVGTGQTVFADDHRGGQQVTSSSYTLEYSSTTAASSDSFGTHVSPVSDFTDYYSSNNTNITINNPNPNCIQTTQEFSCNYYNNGMDFPSSEQISNSWLDTIDGSDNIFNSEDFYFLQQLFNFNM